MPLRKRTTIEYQNIEFSNRATADNFIPIQVGDDKNKQLKERKIRIIGYLISKNGSFYIKNIEQLDSDVQCQVLVKMEYSDLVIPPAVAPCPVQIFGNYVHENNESVVEAKFIQVLSPSMAHLLSKQLQRIKSNFLARNKVN